MKTKFEVGDIVQVKGLISPNGVIESVCEGDDRKVTVVFWNPREEKFYALDFYPEMIRAV